MGGTGQQQYCLRWNNYQNNLTNVFDQLLQSEAFVDVTLACDGNSLKAHKMVLSACSPYFQSLFFENPCSHPIVILKDVKWSELKAIVEFVYRGEINVSQEQLAPLLKVAESLKIRGLADVNRGSGGTSTSESIHPISNGGSGINPASKSQTPSRSTAAVDLEREVQRSPQNNRSYSRHTFHHPSPNGHLRLKRRKMSDERSRSVSPPGDIDVPSPNELEIDSSNGDYEGIAESPIGILEPVTPTNTNNMGSLGPIASSSMIGLHGAGPGTSTPSSTLSNVNELDLKPGIVEMIREEERAKMLESSHGWLGPTSGGPPSGISDSYQYQIQSLWQKCWSTNQSGLHALRFRERGPLKSWRPETMAEAIFAVLREGLSLSQAARKFDIPYPTFVLYANRVHNMLGPSSDGSGGGDLLSDMRPKGRGRPQRILLGTWPEDHIRGVIRAVVFRDGGKEELPFVFNREGVNSQNGLDMTLHQQLASMNPYLGLHHSQTSTNSSPGPSRSKSPVESAHEGTFHVSAELSSSSSTSSTPEHRPRSKHHSSFPMAPTTSSMLHHAPLLIDLGTKASKFPQPRRESTEILEIKSEIFDDDEEEDIDEDLSSLVALRKKVAEETASLAMSLNATNPDREPRNSPSSSI